MNPFVARFFCLLLLFAPAARAADTLEFGGTTYKLLAHNNPKRAKDPTMSLYVPNVEKGTEANTALEVMHWPKAKYSADLGDDWQRSMLRRAIEKPTVLVSPTDPNDIIYEVITFFSGPAGQEVNLRRFFRDPDGKGVTSYLVKWRFFEVDGKVGDESYRSRRDALIAELRQLHVPPPATAPAAPTK